MSINVTPAMQVKFQNNVEMQLQQTTTMLEKAVVVQEDASAEKIKIKDIVGNVMPQRDGTRHGDTKYNHRTFDGVWIPKPIEFTDADLVDNADQLGTSIELTGATTMSATATINRARDIAILEGFYGTIISGKEGTTSTAFPGANILPVTTGGAAGNQKMNVAKLRAANKFLRQQYVDSGLQKWMILTADDNDALLQEIPATSEDFKGSYKGQTDDEGNLQRLLGWNFIHMELDNPMLDTIPALATDGGGFRKTPFWVKPGLVLNYWQRLRTSLDKMPGKKLSVQWFAGMTGAASRTQAGMSGIILNLKG
jgi:hypothetical protein